LFGAIVKINITVFIFFVNIFETLLVLGNVFRLGSASLLDDMEIFVEEQEEDGVE
tara:strand:+ start:2223 stop:2387 length:165 start_codon:yes stop_codon:yes gene_type:complete